MSGLESDNRDISSSKVGGRIGGGLNRDDDEDQEGEEDDHDHDGMQGGGPRNNKNKNKNKRRGYGCGGDFSKARGVVLFPFTKAKKLLKKKSDKRPSSSSSSLSSRVAVTGYQATVDDFAPSFPHLQNLLSGEFLYNKLNGVHKSSEGASWKMLQLPPVSRTQFGCL